MKQEHNNRIEHWREQGARWCALLFAASVGAVCALPVLADTTENAGDPQEATQASIDSKKSAIQDSQKEREDIEDNLTNLQQVKSQLESSRDDLTAYVTELDSQMTSIQTKISGLENEISEGEEKITATRQELAAAKEKQDQQYANMKQRIRFIYEKSDTYLLETLIDSDSISDMLNKATYIDALSEYDAQLLDKYKAQTQLVEVTGQELEEQQKTLETARDGLQQEQSSLSSLEEDKKAQLTSVNASIDLQEESIEAYQQQMAEQDAAIAALEQQVQAEEAELQRQAEEARKKAEEEARQKAEEEARQKAEEEARQQAAAAAASTDGSEENGTEASSETADGTSAGSDTTGSDPASSSSDENAAAYSANSGYRYTGGQFTWPAPSSTGITSPYGYRIHPIYKVSRFHSGLDIAAPSGSPILAAADGIVVAAAYNSSMGNYVMIDHGDSLFTIYMHSSQLEVSKGDAVTAGQEIAKVGSTGASTGPHLHFSVRKNGQYTDPGAYLGSLSYAASSDSADAID